MGRLCSVDGEILFRWGRLCSDTESPRGDFISAKERIYMYLVGRLYFVTPTPSIVRIPVNTLKLYRFQNIGHSAHHWVYNCNSFIMRRKGGFHTATRLQMRINVKNVVKHYNYIYNYKLFVERCFEDRPTQDSGNKVIVHYSSIQAYVTVGYITISQVSHSNITFTFTLP